MFHLILVVAASLAVSHAAPWDETVYDTLASDQGNDLSLELVHGVKSTNEISRDTIQEYLEFYNATDNEVFDAMGFNFVPLYNGMQDNHEARFNIIFPGTKWCGIGNRADNEDDLGYFSNEDECCRSHDHCEDYIEAGETKHGLTNDGLAIKLNCACDLEFYGCLKRINSLVSNKLGRIYFNLVENDCFEEDYPIIGCKRYSFMWKRCKEYKLDKNGEPKYQWFNNPYY